jgi:hypothetical protein
MAVILNAREGSLLTGYDGRSSTRRRGFTFVQHDSLLREVPATKSSYRYQRPPGDEVSSGRAPEGQWIAPGAVRLEVCPSKASEPGSDWGTAFLRHTAPAIRPRRHSSLLRAPATCRYLAAGDERGAREQGARPRARKRLPVGLTLIDAVAAVRRRRGSRQPGV